MLGSIVRNGNMPIQQNKKQSDLEKRLKLLRQQVYGKGTNELEYRDSSKPKDSATFNSGVNSSNSKNLDLTYLSHDLMKIFILSTIAIGAQIVLFILTKNRLLNLNLF